MPPFAQGVHEGGAGGGVCGNVLRADPVHHLGTDRGRDLHTPMLQMQIMKSADNRIIVDIPRTLQNARFSFAGKRVEERRPEELKVSKGGL